MGRDVARKLARRREAARRENHANTMLTMEYAAVLDSHTDRYHALRDTWVGSPHTEIHRQLTTAVQLLTQRVVNRHFPGLVADDYETRFNALARELRQQYGVDVAPVFGQSLDTTAWGNLHADRNPFGRQPA